MSQMSHVLDAPPMDGHGRSAGVFVRSLVIGADGVPHGRRPVRHAGDPAVARAPLWRDARRHGPCGQRQHARHGGGGLGIAYFSQQIDRRLGILVALMVLAIPTALLASAPNLTVFTLLRVMQGLCMASAFTLTLAYLGEHCSAADTASAFAAYITGNVASNLIGRLISAAVADHLGLASNFYFFALLNLAGAVLVYFTVQQDAADAPHRADTAGSPLAAWGMHLRNPQLRASFGIAFCILFAFIGTFTYVNFVLVRSPLMVGMMTLGFVYFVFLPSIVTTPLAGRAVQWFGTRPTMWASLGLAGVGLPLLLTAEPAGGAHRHGAGRRRHVLRAGDRNRLCRPRRHIRPRLGERHLSRLLFLRRSRRQRRAGPGLRPSRLAGDGGRHRCVDCDCRTAGGEAADDTGCCRVSLTRHNEQRLGSLLGCSLPSAGEGRAG